MIFHVISYVYNILNISSIKIYAISRYFIISIPASSTGKRLCKSMIYGAFPFYMLDWTYPYYIQFMRFWGSQLNRKLNYELNPNAV